MKLPKTSKNYVLCFDYVNNSPEVSSVVLVLLHVLYR